MVDEHKFTHAIQDDEYSPLMEDTRLPYCDAQTAGDEQGANWFCCTRTRGHTGIHVAHFIDRRVICIWETGKIETYLEPLRRNQAENIFTLIDAQLKD